MRKCLARAVAARAPLRVIRRVATDGCIAGIAVILFSGSALGSPSPLREIALKPGDSKIVVSERGAQYPVLVGELRSDDRRFTIVGVPGAHKAFVLHLRDCRGGAGKIVCSGTGPMPLAVVKIPIFLLTSGNTPPSAELYLS